MAKKKSKKSQKSEEPPKQRITLEALAAMSDSDDEEIPQSQWDAKAKNLAQAIESGKFDHLLDEMKGGDDDVEIEEATIDSSDEVEEGENQKEEEEQVSEESGKSQSDSEEESEEDSDEKEDDENDEIVKDEEAAKVEADEEEESEEEEENEEEEEKDEEEDDEEDEKVKMLKANNSQNSKALSVVTAELVAAHARLPWEETFDVISKKPLPFGESEDPDEEVINVHDDLKREVAFYNMALEAVHSARKLCKKANIPFSRPDDFFAEMVKTDDHMAKVKDKLIFENKKMEAVAQRKANREHKLRAKESHANKLADKAKRKKEHFQQVEEWANSVAKNRGGALQDDADDMFMNKRGPNKKRQAADRKFGHGGKRGRFKQNDKATLNDTSGFNPRGNFAGGMKKTAAKSKGGAGAGRQGKRARDASRSRNRS